jgi:hypothetical protein
MFADVRRMHQSPEYAGAQIAIAMNCAYGHRDCI